ncbi:EKC/KEOPS complex subunit TPRKB isoform X1 [Osmia lignaria lignaria]|uniref:EKC/KEOPS complex subunit TPRKB isoform X1 n=1 Tax=Osmia lignaria lignaria TaxID=1437193 RepID=UPI00147952E2|nr:EKC/KEOPS complex subunit TPRKB-like isoform X1 [Osmia lignaria]
MDDYTVPLDAETEMFCTLYLFKNVQNSNEICKKVMSGELPCCIIKASLIADPFQLIISSNKAAINAKMNQLTTKNVYNEILFNLSMSKNISRALTEFGISDSDKNILIAIIHKADEKTTLNTVMNTIKGEKIPVSKLPEYTDLELIKQTYKIDKDELKVSSLINSIVSRISGI